MVTSVLPLTKALFCCDDVLTDPASGKTHVLGIFTTVRPDAGSSYPFRLGRLCVFAQWTGGIGEVVYRVEVVSARRGTSVYTSPEWRVRFVDRRRIVSTCFRILECPFPAPGEYVIELYAQNVLLEDRRLQLLP